ncbi:MAG: ThuA domain-containing protein [Planctomycetaceae bacterium]
MSRLLASLLIVFSCSAGLPRLSAADKPAPLKGLLLTGGCCHDYEHQKRIITDGISQRANIVWDVVHEGGESRDHRLSVYEQKDWARKYDIIVHNECFGAVVDAQFVKSIVAHQEGVPAVFIHCALHSYRNSGSADSWRELIGVTSKSHEGKRPLDVVCLDAEHPVMQGFPAKWTTPNGELYKIEHHWPNCTPLAQAYGQDTKKDHTCIWVNHYAGTPVFGISLGHHNETMKSEEWLGVTARGVLWACGKLQADGSPMPGYEGTGIQPIDLDAPIPEPQTPTKK